MLDWPNYHSFIELDPLLLFVAGGADVNDAAGLGQRASESAARKNLGHRRNRRGGNKRHDEIGDRRPRRQVVKWTGKTVLSLGASPLFQRPVCGFRIS